MSFQPKETKVACPDFKPCFLWRSICKLSYECKKIGYIAESNSQRCTGMKIPPRPKRPGAMKSTKGAKA